MTEREREEEALKNKRCCFSCKYWQYYYCADGSKSHEGACVHSGDESYQTFDEVCDHYERGEYEYK